MKEVLNDPKEACFIWVMADSSSYLNMKLAPLLIRYYHPEKHIMVKASELVS
jgi:hypothetical protein